MQDDMHSANTEIPMSERRRWLDEVLRYRLSQRGWRLEFYSETSAIIAHGHPVNHWLHALMTIVTGIWLLVWLFAIGFDNHRRIMIYVHPSGKAEASRIR